MIRVLRNGMDFDNILLCPTMSDISSRSDVSILTPEGLLPIISAPMRGISCKGVVAELGKLGGLGILHRFYSLEERVSDAQEIYNSIGSKFGVAVSVDEVITMKFREFIQRDFYPSVICLDVANGYIPSVRRAVRVLFSFLAETGIATMAGNVTSAAGLKALEACGASLVRVGIGAGNLCTTRNVTGVGMPQIAAIKNCSSAEDRRAIVVADGGIKNSGDAMKAFAFGADYVMLGSLLAYAEEADNDGTIYGMASRELQQAFPSGSHKSVEGISKRLTDKKRPLKEIIEEFCWGLRSACTYLNCMTLQEAKEKVSSGEILIAEIDPTASLKNKSLYDG